MLAMKDVAVYESVSREEQARRPCRCRPRCVVVLSVVVTASGFRTICRHLIPPRARSSAAVPPHPSMTDRLSPIALVINRPIG
jgi:hypothetical protein